VQELVVYNAQNTVTVNSVLKDLKDLAGGSATLSLLKSGAGTLLLTAGNSYTGGTTVSQGSPPLGGSAGTVVVPGSLSITNATVTTVANPGQIAPDARVLLNSNAILNLVGTIV
jgi:autotransporter-associated beta strand protein